ncbi:MAG: hypothetical protein E6R09_12855 [Rhodocyclaceae bacterium]|nr:MAG: hypothetical protein E6R09_12855 [Rhodocyclaceae bacterium]
MQTQTVENDFYSIASAVTVILDAAQKHAPEAVERAAGMLDMSCAHLLRGVSYLSFVLEEYGDGDNDRLKSIARGALADMTALAAVLLELANLGEINKALKRMEA